MFKWIDKQDDIDFVLAKDINDIAHSVIELEKTAVKVVDQTYTPDSENAQSGKAVAKAVAIEQKRSDNTFSNALKGNKSDTAILIDDVSPVTHDMGVKVRSKNLFDISKLVTSTEIINNSNGSITVKSYGVNSETLGTIAPNLVNGKTYVLSCVKSNDNARNGIYLNTVLSLGKLTPITFGTPFVMKEEYREAVTIWYCEQNDNGENIENTLSNIQLELGSTATAYTPYVPDLTAVKVSRCGKNLFSLANRTWANFGANANTTIRTINKDNFYFKITANNYAINSETNYEIVNGNSIKITTTNAYGLGVPFHLIAGQQYTISCIKSDNIKCRINIGYYDIEGNHLSFEFDVSTFTMPENAHWAILCFVGFINIGIAEELTFTDIQLEIGSTATDYEPYKEYAEYTPNANGTVNGVTSLYPNTTLMTDTDGVLIDCEYNRDINKAFAALEAAIATNNS